MVSTVYAVKRGEFIGILCHFVTFILLLLRKLRLRTHVNGELVEKEVQTLQR